MDRWTVLTIVGVGAFMFWGAGHYTVFDDEAFSCRRYVMPLGEMVTALWHGVEPDPPLYYVLENLWVRGFGVGPVGLRGLSILLFLAGLVVVRRAGQAWFDRTTGLAAMVLCAVHPAHLFFGLAARWYSLMFLLVAVLLWATGRIITVEGGLAVDARRRGPDWWSAQRTLRSCGTGVSPVFRPPGRRCHKQGRTGTAVVWWVLAAAGVLYTNYFGPVIVVLVWGVGVALCRRRAGRTWPLVVGGLAAMALFSPWLAPLWRQVATFPGPAGDWAAYVATAARTSLALTTGNLASIGAWWVWLPMALGAFGVVILLLRHWRFVWPVGAIALGCLAAGVASRTMIDKYVMTFSGPVCLLVAALVVRGLGVQRLEGRRRGFDRTVAGLSLACLAVGWLGCGVTLVSQRHWSSLRWLDPFPRVVRDVQASYDIKMFPGPVMSHPSARYYYALLRVEEQLADLPSAKDVRVIVGAVRTDPVRWRDAFEGAARPMVYPHQFAVTPTRALAWFDSLGPAPVVVTVETSGFASLPEWDALHGYLEGRYNMTEETRYLEDRDAAWKDRLDPGVRHAPWRIVVRRWDLRKSAGPGPM